MCVCVCVCVCVCAVRMNINLYITILINMWDTIVKWVIMLIKSVFTWPRLPDVGAGDAQYSCHAADPPQTSRARL